MEQLLHEENRTKEAAEPELMHFRRNLGSPVRVVFLLILVLCVFAVFLILKWGSEQKESDEYNLELTDDITISDVEPNYYEGTEDMDYNYICNPQKLEKYEIPIDATLMIPDELNLYLKTSGYYGNKLTIKNPYKKSLNLTFDVSIGDTGDILKCKYSYRSNELECYIQNE